MVWLVLHYWPDRDAFSRQFAAFWDKSHGIRIVTLGIKSVLWTSYIATCHGFGRLNFTDIFSKVWLLRGVGFGWR